MITVFAFETLLVRMEEAMNEVFSEREMDKIPMVTLRKVTGVV